MDDYTKPSRQNRRQKRIWKRPKKKVLDHRLSAWQSLHPVLNTPQLAVSAPVSLSGFFTPIGFDFLWSGSAQSYNTRKGKAASGLTAVFKYLAAPLNRGRALNKSVRKPIMANTKGKHAHPRLSVYNFVRRFAGPVLAYRLAYTGSQPARIEAAKAPIFAGRVAA